jgi:alcohol dehydrogenase class IV
MNALCLPPTLAFNRQFVPDEIARFGGAIGGEPVARTRELALLGSFHNLREFGVPADELASLAEAVVGRAGNAANPHTATADEVHELLRSIW